MRTALILLLLNSVTPAIGADRTIEAWGQVIDPDRDCEVSLQVKQLTITVPGKLHDLIQRSAMNAPRVMQEIVGDFTLQVKVSGRFAPGPESTSKGGLRFNSGGLLVWHDEGNYIRLERNLVAVGATSACFPPLFELFSAGQYRGANKPITVEPYFKGSATWLRLKREGDYFKAAVSHDGSSWEELPKQELILPDKLMVGVAALNTSNTPHTVTFSDLKLTHD